MVDVELCVWFCPSPAEGGRSPTEAGDGFNCAANRAGLHVDNVVYEGLMAADSVLRADDTSALGER